MSKGSLACVGTGMMLGAHIGPRARRHIEEADVVFVAVSDPLVELWVQGMNRDVRSLQPFYAEGKPRRDPEPVLEPVVLDRPFWLDSDDPELRARLRQLLAQAGAELESGSAPSLADAT